MMGRPSPSVIPTPSLDRMFGLLAAATALAACASAPGKSAPYNPLAASPPSLSTLIAEIDRSPVCADTHVVGPAGARTLRALKTCPGHFPAALLRAEVVGVCRSMFDLTDAGTPVALETRCRAADSSGRPLPPEWDAVARAALAYSTRRAISQFVFPAADDPASEGKWRTNLSQRMRYEFEGENLGMRGDPSFERAPPAPPFTAEQREYFAKADAATPFNAAAMPSPANPASPNNRN